MFSERPCCKSLGQEDHTDTPLHTYPCPTPTRTRAQALGSTPKHSICLLLGCHMSKRAGKEWRALCRGQAEHYRQHYHYHYPIHRQALDLPRDEVTSPGVTGWATAVRIPTLDCVALSPQPLNLCRITFQSCFFFFPPQREEQAMAWIPGLQDGLGFPAVGRLGMT